MHFNFGDFDSFYFCLRLELFHERSESTQMFVSQIRYTIFNILYQFGIKEYKSLSTPLHISQILIKPKDESPEESKAYP